MTTNDRRPSGDNGQQAGRQFVKFSFFKLDPAFRRLPDEKQRAAKLEFISAIRSFNRSMLLCSYSLFGLRGDVDFMLWQVAATPDPLQDLARALFSTTLGPYLIMPQSFFGTTRRSIYDIGSPAGNEDSGRLKIQPGNTKFLFVYPFVKTRAWYALSFEERQRMMNEHIQMGRKYPDIRINTTYSFGIDDQEFVVAFEGDDPTRFVDLVMELRESEASRYTLRDTPMFVCRSLPLAETLDSLGGPPVSNDASLREHEAGEWMEVAGLDELPAGASLRVYFDGQQVALFNVGGQLYAINNRCPHARGPLCDGTVRAGDNGPNVTCPWHQGTFDLATGERLNAIPPTGVSTYRVKVEAGRIYLSEGVSSEAISNQLSGISTTTSKLTADG